MQLKSFWTWIEDKDIIIQGSSDVKITNTSKWSSLEEIAYIKRLVSRNDVEPKDQKDVYQNYATGILIWQKEE